MKTIITHGNTGNPSAQAARIKELKSENADLRAMLKKANANHEEFERRWYLEQDESEKLRAELAALKPKTCEWSRIAGYDSDSDYQTSCGEAWSFVDGGVAENGMHFCHNCGGKVVEAVPLPEPEA